MKRAAALREALAGVELEPGIQALAGRSGLGTAEVRGVLLHSRYDPGQEAERLIASASLDASRPVLLAGLGLGYAALALRAHGFTCAAVEPAPGVAKLALAGPLAAEEDLLIGVGDLDAIAASPAFRDFAARGPQVLVPPAYQRLYPEYIAGLRARMHECALTGRRMNIAVVGPMHGGSAPMTGYLTRALRRLGHNARAIENTAGWEAYQAVRASLRGEKPVRQLGALLTQFLTEWTYARVAEFAPEICIVLAQAPVGADFPARIARHGIVSAYWFVENWRHMGYWRELAPRYDCFFHIQPGAFEQELAAAGCRAQAFVQTGCDPELHRPVTLSPEESAAYACDVAFAGAGYANRNALFRGLTDYRFKIWGVEWHARELAPLVQDGGRAFDTETYMKIIAGARINLNLHSSAMRDGVDPDCDAINPRVFEIAAAGGFQLCDPCQGLERHFDFDAELPVYRDLRALRGLIDHYLAHDAERAAVAEAARTRALAEHTYDRRAEAMLDVIRAHCGDRLLARGIRQQRSIGEVADSAGRDTPLGAFLAQLPADAPFTQEELAERIPRMAGEASYPARVFMYLNEVRSFAEAIMREQR